MTRKYSDLIHATISPLSLKNVMFWVALSEYEKPLSVIHSERFLKPFIASKHKHLKYGLKGYKNKE